MPMLHIACLRPGGMNRGGIRHDRGQAHDPAKFTPAQLREMLADQDLVLTVGDALTEEHITAIEAKAAKSDKAKV